VYIPLNIQIFDGLGNNAGFPFATDATILRDNNFNCRLVVAGFYPARLYAEL
jgi:hypothetical protein